MNAIVASKLAEERLSHWFCEMPWSQISVFLEANGLRDLWRERRVSTVLQLGFGAGTLSCAIWEEWRRTASEGSRLELVVLEPHPFARDDLAKLMEHGPLIFRGYAKEILKQWPEHLRGMHRLEFEGGRLGLTLVFLEHEIAFKKLRVRTDAVCVTSRPREFLPVVDGADLRGLSRLVEKGASIVGVGLSVQQVGQLNGAGFAVSGLMTPEGVGEMFQGRFIGEVGRGEVDWSVPECSSALVIGAGVAGTAVAESLARRGVHVTVFDRNARVAAEASGNLAAVMLPMISRDDGAPARFSRAAFLLLRRRLLLMRAEGRHVQWSGCGVLQMAKNAREESLFSEFREASAFPQEFARFLNAEEVSEELGTAASVSGCLFPGGGWVWPESLCEERLRGTGRVDLRLSAPVYGVQRDGDEWLVLGADGGVLASAPVLVLAAGSGAEGFVHTAGLRFKKVRGQVTHLPLADMGGLRRVLSGDGYLAGSGHGVACLGATYEFETEDASLSVESHRLNLKRLQGLHPGLAKGWSPETLGGRVGFRSLTPDRMPLVGALPVVGENYGVKPDRDVPREPGLFGVLGLGSRGVVWSALSGELVAAQICGEGWPVERDLAAAVDPARFRLRERSAE